MSVWDVLLVEKRVGQVRSGRMRCHGRVYRTDGDGTCIHSLTRRRRWRGSEFQGAWVGWLVGILGHRGRGRRRGEPSRLAAVPLERCRIRAVWQSSVRLWLGSLSQFPVAAAAHLRERKRRSGLGRDMQVPELLRGRLHNLHSSWSRPPEAGRTEMQAVTQYVPCYVRLRV